MAQNQMSFRVHSTRSPLATCVLVMIISWICITFLTNPHLSSKTSAVTFAQEAEDNDSNAITLLTEEIDPLDAAIDKMRIKELKQFLKARGKFCDECRDRISWRKKSQYNTF